MATVIQLLNDIDARLPNSFTEETKLAWMNDVQRKLTKYFDDIETVYEFVASSSMAYTLSTSIRMDRITHVYTGDSTAIEDITSTTVWTEHDYLGADDVLEGYKYYTPTIEHYNTTGFNTDLGLYPESTEVRVARVFYKTKLTDLTTETSGCTPLFDSEYHDILKYGTLEIIAKSGNDPDVELANNYYSDYLEILKEIKKDVAQKKMKTPKFKLSYKEWTW
ncbi:MAG: hypothetical protein JRI72_00090 [Deltaproteobacteria bacterium]|nr:hypothetical protein [Deltaproteobacteria bacterium]